MKHYINTFGFNFYYLDSFEASINEHNRETDKANNVLMKAQLCNESELDKFVFK